jgi:hypothetical protein
MRPVVRAKLLEPLLHIRIGVPLQRLLSHSVRKREIRGQGDELALRLSSPLPGCFAFW